MLDQNDIKIIREIVLDTTQKVVHEELIPIQKEQTAIREEQKLFRDELIAVREEQKSFREELIAVREEQKSFREELKDIRRELAEVRSDLERLENTLLDEIAKTQTYLENQIGELKRRMDDMEQYYRIRRLEDSNSMLMRRKIDDLRQRVECLEKKIV